MRQSLRAVLTTLLLASASWPQPSVTQDTLAMLPAHSDETLVEQAKLEARLQNAMLLNQAQQTHLQDLRQSLQEQLADIRLQVETDQLDEQEARWQVKMALASHRQGRAALLKDEQIASLQTIYNEHGEKDTEPFSLLHLNPLQQEHIRLLLWEQGEAWRRPTESDTPPNAGAETGTETNASN